MRFFRRFAYWLHARSHQSELSDELSFHREMLERDFLRQGLSASAALQAARRTMGNETFMREESRAVWSWMWADALRQDCIHTIRGLRSSPGFTLAVVLTLALGLGANAAMFNVVDRLLFRPPPHLIDPASTHRVYLYRTSQGVERQTGGQYVRYVDLARWTSSFSLTAAVMERSLPVGTGDATREMPVAAVTAGFFRFFNAPPAIGRYFTAAEDRAPEGAAVAVLSDDAWRTRFGARRDVLGSTLQIGAARYTIIGVSPSDFVGFWPERPPTLFIPISALAPTFSGATWSSSYGNFIGVEMIVRRRPGVDTARAASDLTAAFRRSFQTQLDVDGITSTTLAQLRPRAVVGPINTERGPEASSVARVATWLSGVAFIVLIIAAANVTNLMLGRAARRRRETAVRVALGVSRRRLVAQTLIESTLLAVGGCAVGLLTARWINGAMYVMFMPASDAASPIADARTLAFAFGLTICVGLLAGAIPALQVGRGDVANQLKAGAREGTYRRSGVRAALLLAQGALSVVLLVGAGLFVRSLHNVRQVRLGYDVDPVLVVDMNMRGLVLDTASARALNGRVLEAAKSVPGVVQAALTKMVPFEGVSSGPLYIEGVDSVDKFGEFDMIGVSPEYFPTAGTRILRGRGIESSDATGQRRVMVVEEAMARALWPGQDPIGRCVRIDSGTAPCSFVVGIAENVRTHTIAEQHDYYSYYLPIAQMDPYFVALYVRTRDKTAIAEAVRQRLQREMPGVSYVSVRPLSGVVDAQTRSWALGSQAFAMFGMLALIVAGLGLYSVISYGVTQRTHELWVRMAIGARRSDVMRLVVGEGLRFGVVALAIGAAASMGAAPLIQGLLFDEPARDPAVLAFVCGILLLVAIIASAIPAARAARLDPKIALREG
jgi:putative ABC transport system permease protein